MNFLKILNFHGFQKFCTKINVSFNSAFCEIFLEILSDLRREPKQQSV